MSQVISITLRLGRERSVKNRHPWIFSGAFAQIPRDVVDGDTVEILDAKGSRLAYGHYNANASIAVRAFDFSRETLVIDDAYWERKLQHALDTRLALGLLSDKSTGCRLVYSEGDGLPGLIIDLFGDVASVHIKTEGMARLAPLIERFLHSHGFSVDGRPNLFFMERNLQFPVDIETGQKTGYFLDQRDNRQLVSQYAQNRVVLDAFSYSGGFSAFAIAGGAQTVHSVDVSEEATALCKKTIAVNFPNCDRHEAITADCFQYLKDMPANFYDLIVLDPPAFSKNADTVQRAARGYKDINWRAIQKIRSGGLLFTFSCSQHISTELFRQIIYGASKDSGRHVQVLHQMHQAADHPIDIFHPEGEYLKGLVLRVSDL